MADSADAYEAIFAALAHPARRRILISLNFAGGAMSAGAIAGLFGHAWPTTTRHLQTLEAAGIVRHERQGRTRLYRLDKKRLALARDWLGWFERDPVTAQELSDDQRHAPPVPAQSRSGGR
ncbi:MAG TPA: metalloregulator ArsR/SmtB family transcription factor [Allosphingosinicella sp.]|jgi:DNA-binding transcriptional ArsR family regulator|nr:metalloregulator ArsR/SmtB family transcription factor [Allosphingosinicella sp.]